jgi:hypothetical protein
MKTKILLASLVLVVAFVVSGCSLAQGVIGNKGGTVSELWSDVPAPPNATKANIDIPPLVNLMIQGFIQAANAQNGNSDTKLESFNFIGYQTGDTPQQVADFYTADKMKAAGWDSEDTGGCQVGSGDSGVAGGFCAFGKKDASGKQTVLMILPVQDDNTKQTQIFFIRFEGTKK